jgi:hypothetical protein
VRVTPDEDHRVATEGARRRRYFIASRRTFDGVALAFKDGLLRSIGVARVVYYEDRKNLLALSTLHARFGRRIGSHGLAAYLAIITWRGYLKIGDVGRTKR